MKSLSPEKILENRNKIFEYINKYISGSRKDSLMKFYEKYDQRLTMMPASHKREFHNAFVGGYYDHVVRVIECALKIDQVWREMGVDSSTYTQEELVFSALNHDLGKMGDDDNQSYLPQEDAWRKEKLGEEWMFNKSLQFASVPDRGLFLLQSHNIKYTFNEMLTIQTHDGLYDEANKKYLMNYSSEQKPRTSLPYIIHQADLMAARIEWEMDWLPELNNKNKQINSTQKKTPLNQNKKQSKALGSIKTNSLLSALDKI